MKHIKAKKPYASLLLHFTISYLLLILIPVIMGTAYYGYILDVSTKQTSYSNMLIMKNSMAAIENSLYSIRDFTNTINALPFVEEIMNKEHWTELTISSLQEAVKTLPKYDDMNHYVSCYYLYCKKSEILLGPMKAFLNTKLYYDDFFRNGEQPYEEWKSAVLDNLPRTDIIRTTGIPGAQEGNGLLYQSPYVGKRTGKVVGQLLYFIDGERLRQTLMPAFQLGAGFMYIVDESGTFLIEMEQNGYQAVLVEDLPADSYEGSLERILNGEKITISYCRSQDFGWTYVIAVPKSALLAKSRQSVGVTISGTIVLAVVGVLLIIGSYTYNKRPLLNLITGLPDNLSDPATEVRKRVRNGLWRLSNTVSAIAHSNLQMEDQLRKQRQQLKEAYLIQLVHGELLEDSHIEGHMKEYGIDLRGNRFRGIYIGLPPEGTDAETCDRQEQLIWGLRRYGQELIPCFWADGRYLTSLYMASEGGSLEAFFKDLHFTLMNDYQLEVVFYIGIECESVADVYQSFYQARRLVSQQKGASTKMLYVQEAGQQETERYDYTHQDEEKLLDMVAIQNKEEINKLLEELYQRNFVIRQLSSNMRGLLLSRMAGTLVCSGYDMGFPLELYDPSMLSTEAFFHILQEQYGSLCQEAARRQHGERIKMEHEIVRYLKEHFADSTLSLTSLSLEFGMTESYLSTLVKQLVGETFSSYVEKLRISYANELLRNLRLSIAEISLQAGYDSATSFGRAYKRAMGCTPSQYRKLQETDAPNKGNH